MSSRAVCPPCFHICTTSSSSFMPAMPSTDPGAICLWVYNDAFSNFHDIIATNLNAAAQAKGELPKGEGRGGGQRPHMKDRLEGLL